MANTNPTPSMDVTPLPSRTPAPPEPQPSETMAMRIARAILKGEPLKQGASATKAFSKEELGHERAQASRQTSEPVRHHVLEALRQCKHTDTQGMKKAMIAAWGYNLVADSLSKREFPTEIVGSRFVVGDHKIEVFPEANLIVIDRLPPVGKEAIIATIRKELSQTAGINAQVLQTIVTGHALTFSPEETDDMEQQAFVRASEMLQPHEEKPPVSSRHPGRFLEAMTEKSSLERSVSFGVQPGSHHENADLFASIAMTVLDNLEKDMISSLKAPLSSFLIEKNLIDEASEKFGIFIPSRFSLTTIEGVSFARVPTTGIWHVLDYVQDPNDIYALIARSCDPNNPVHQPLFHAVDTRTIQLHTSEEVFQALQEAKRKVEDLLVYFYSVVEQLHAKGEKHTEEELIQGARSAATIGWQGGKEARSFMICSVVAEMQRRFETQRMVRKTMEEIQKTLHKRAVEEKEKFKENLRAELMEQIASSHHIRHELEEAQQKAKL